MCGVGPGRLVQPDCPVVGSRFSYEHNYFAVVLSPSNAGGRNKCTSSLPLVGVPTLVVNLCPAKLLTLPGLIQNLYICCRQCITRMSEAISPETAGTHYNIGRVLLHPSKASIL